MALWRREAFIGRALGPRFVPLQGANDVCTGESCCQYIMGQHIGHQSFPECERVCFNAYY